MTVYTLNKRETCLSGGQQTGAVYRFSFDVNPSDVLELDATLGDCILHDPVKAVSLFQSVCYLSIKTLSLIDHIETENQVNVVLKPTHLPPFPNYCLDLSEFPRGYGPMRPLALEGLVIAMTRVTKYTQGARFLCSEEKCPCSRGFQHIRVHAPGATESATVRSDFTCFLCSSPLKEDVKSRVLGDKQLVELIHVRAVDVLGVHDAASLRYQSVTLFLRDELCNSMRIGHLYQVVGIPAHVHQWPNVTWSVEACSVRPWTPKCPHLVSSNFQNLQTAMACSPWRFAAIVANSFGSPVIPPGLYNTLKLGLLLSLVQTEDNPDSPYQLDVLALTSETLIIDRLMRYSLPLASRGIHHTLTGDLSASLSRDEHGAGTANIHAGSALLASGGVCLLGDLATYKKDKMDMIQSALESRTVSVFIPAKKYGDDMDQQLSFPIQCNFWALADSASPSKRTARCDNVVLGSVLLAHARELKVDMSPEAERMIHSYYMASRRVRSDSTQRSTVSVTSVKLLIALAQAHAKLSLRTQVLEEDAVIAVLLCESSVTLKHGFENEKVCLGNAGASALVFPPDTVFPCALRDLDSLHQRDLMLEESRTQISHFVQTYATCTVEE
ncbi:minichromosome maintenance domain-containing protein 2 [Sinocyclocheilus grahami]|uniref:minichromosome maintenance domain-containing protein 2 n=1 Tax=Sinocyclocheilus grahami TaxID=75366 RepID=UPI0007AD29A2|nr:PREDICTED: MCM domain-containing protein 2 [Sinocyclocheilus grahami]